MEIPTKSKTVSIILKVIVILAATAGVFISAYASKETFMGGGKVFMYFTIQSNIAVALLALAGIFLLAKGSHVSSVWYVVKFVATVSITLTGVVFAFILAPTLGPYVWNFQNILTHVVVPAAAILDFFVTGVYGDLKKSDAAYVVLPPLAYVIYAGIGYAAGWEFSAGANDPYFFLNWGGPAGAFGFIDKFPFMGCVWWILALLALLLVAGYLYLRIIEGLKKAMDRGVAGAK